EFANTVFMWAANDKIYTLEKSGTMYEVNPASGAWKQVGAAGAWKNTMVGTVANNMLYTVETTGALYETNLTTGVWKQIGKPDYQHTAFITGGSKLHTIET